MKLKILFHFCAALGCALLISSCGEQLAKKTATNAPEKAVAPVAKVEDQTPGFSNPIIPNGADPWLQFYKGNYYLTTTTWTSQLVMRKSPTLAGLFTATPINIWSESAADRCCNFWAFEFHRLKSPQGYRWYVMYTSGTKDNYDGQHLSVIESQGDDPMGPYTYKGSPMPKSWNIDGTYLEVNNQLYLLWSEWQKDEQLIWSAKMSNPWTIVGEKKIIARPTFEWEKSGMKVNEGPEVLQKNGKTMVVFSASFCDTEDYKLGVLELNGNDPLADNAWHKIEKPFFEKANGVFGPGHNGFFKSPDGKEDWLVYHGNSKAEEGCGQTRELRAQKFSWEESATGPLPNFGKPAANGEKMASPSGENGPLVTQVLGTPIKLVTKENQCLVNEKGLISFADCSLGDVIWTLDYTSDGQYRLANAQGLFLSQESATALSVTPWNNQPNQQWVISTSEPAKGEQSAWVKLTNSASKTVLGKLRIQPVGSVVISSIQSGKVISVAATKKQSENAELSEWVKEKSQQWEFNHVENGFYSIANLQGHCLGVAEKTIVPGTSVIATGCGDKSAQWSLEPLANGTQKIANRQSGLVLDVASCGVANHTALAQAPNLNTICQQFRLLPVNQ